MAGVSSIGQRVAVCINVYIVDRPLRRRLSNSRTGQSKAINMYLLPSILLAGTCPLLGLAAPHAGATQPPSSAIKGKYLVALKPESALPSSESTHSGSRACTPATYAGDSRPVRR